MCFFLQTLQGFNRTYPGLFDKGNDEQGGDEEPGNETADQFNKRYGWIYSTEQVARLEDIPLDLAYELPVVQVLNDLSYLKAKAEHEKRLLKEWSK